MYQRPYPRYLCSAPATTLRSPCRAQTHTRMAGGAATSKAQAGDVRAQEVRRSTYASTPGRPRLESPRQTWTQAPRHDHCAYAQPTARYEPVPVPVPVLTSDDGREAGASKAGALRIRATRPSPSPIVDTLISRTIPIRTTHVPALAHIWARQPSASLAGEGRPSAAHPSTYN